MFSKKKIIPAYLFRQNLPSGVRIFLKKIISKYFNFWGFDGFEKLLFTIKLLIKRDQQIMKKIALTISETIISWNFCLVELNLEELDLLGLSLVINFFKKIRQLMFYKLY